MKKIFTLCFLIGTILLGATPKEIKSEFEANAARAKNKYKNQTAIVEIDIKKISEGAFGNTLNIVDKTGAVMVVIPENKYNDDVFNLDAGQKIKVEVRPREMTFGIVSLDFIKFIK